MNSVHELGSRTMSKNLTQEKYRVKPGQKQVECTECTAFGQPARPGPAPSPGRTPLPRAWRALPRACRALARRRVRPRSRLRSLACRSCRLRAPLLPPARPARAQSQHAQCPAPACARPAPPARAPAEPSAPCASA